MSARCGGCRFFEHWEGDGLGNKGACRRRSPAPSEYSHETAQWPVVRVSDWCGEGVARGA